MSHDLTQLGVAELLRAFDAGTATASEAVAATLDAIDARNDDLGAYVHIATRAAALDAAATIDEARAAGDELGPLAGVPIAIKDNMCQEGTPTTAASEMLRGFVAPYSATVVERLEAAGAIVIGKTNLDEFSMGSSTEHSAFGPSKNPHDPTRTPGGSSGGSAAAVVADLCAAALGSDTGGSIRQPASHSGVVGLKPTYGRVSRFGLIAFASSLDQIGPMTKTVADAGLLLQAIAGHDPHDMTSSKEPVDASYTADLDAGVAGLTIGVPTEYMQAGECDAEVLEIVRERIRQLEAAGAEVREISLPHTEYAVATYYLIATAEASSNLARYDGVRYGHRAEDAEDLEQMYAKSRAEGFGDEVKRRIMLGTFVLSSGFYEAYYERAQKVRALIARDFTRAFQEVDVIASPVTPSPAFPFGAKSDPLQMYLEDVYTTSCNLAGLPGLSVPAGAVDGLPVGMQLMAERFDEATLLRAGRAVEAIVEADDHQTKE